MRCGVRHARAMEELVHACVIRIFDPHHERDLLEHLLAAVTADLVAAHLLERLAEAALLST